MPYVIVLLTVLIIFFTARLAANTEDVQETSAYTRVTNCIVAKGASTQAEKELCYVRVEKDTDKSLERFDEQTDGEN